MADNVDITAGSGTTIATDQCTVGGVSVQVPRGKVGFGADGTYTEVTASAGLPVAQQGTWTVTANAGSGTLAVSAASLPLPTGAATAANQATANASLASIDGKTPALGQALAAASVPVVLTASQLATLTPLATVAATQSGTWNVGTVANVVHVDDNAGSLTVDNAGTFAVQASQSGTWSVRAQDGSGNALTSATRGSERALSVQIVDGSGAQVTAFGGSGGTASNFGSAFPSIGTAVGAKDSTGTNLAALNLDASGFLKVNVAAGGGSGGTSSSFAAAVPSTGTAAGFSDGTNMQLARVFDADSGAGTQYVAGVVLRGSASGGSVELATGTNPLRVDPTGTTTQPVSAASLPLPSGAATSAKQPALGTAGSASTDVLTVQGIASMTALKVDGSAVTQPVSGTFWQATQPVSGTVTANAGTGSFTVSQATGTNLHAVVDSGTITTVSAVTAITNALPAGTNVLGVAVAPQQTGAIYSGTTALTPKFAAITASSSGATTIVAAVTSKKIRVLSLFLQANGAVNAKWQSHVTPTDLTGLAYLAQNGGYVLNHSPAGHFETVAGEALDLNLSGAVAVGGMLTYIEV